jgi:aminomethyltransferase
MSAYATDQSGSVALLSVQGPRSRDFLLSITQEADLENQKYFWFSRGVINETRVLISRTGYTGELGYELYIPSEEAASMWEYLLRAGAEFGLQPYGVAAMQSLRIEKAFPLYGPDIDENHNPFELGLNRWIRFDKRQFIGRDALLQIQDTGLDERWTGLVLESKVPAQAGERIFSISNIRTVREKMFTGSEAGDELDIETARELVGVVTSSAVGHSVECTLALGYVRVTHTYPGAQLLVEANGRPTLAKVVNTPFFDPQGVRLRSRGPRKISNS